MHFNQDQITNLIQTVGKVGGSVLGTAGATGSVGTPAANAWSAGVGFALAFVSWWFSHHSNTTPASTVSETTITTITPPANK